MAIDARHRNQSPSNGGVHVSHSFEFASEAARLAEAVVATDIGKIALQTDTDSFFILASVGPAVWLPIAGSALSDHGGLSGLLDDDHPQYYRLDGYRALTGDMDVDGYNLLNVGEINNQQFYGPRTSDPPAVGDPTPEDGDTYFNIPIGEMMFYDDSRSKWLTVKAITIQAGRNGSTNAGTFYRSINGMVLDAATRGIPVPRGTIVSLAISRTDVAAATLEALANGVVEATLAHSSSGSTRDDTVDADFTEGVLSFRNMLGGGQTNNVQIVALIRRRA